MNSEDINDHSDLNKLINESNFQQLVPENPVAFSLVLLGIIIFGI